MGISRRSVKQRKQRITNHRRRIRGLESLETRLLLNADWQNPFTTRDTNFDRVVTPIDALVPINELNNPQFIDGTGALPDRAAHTSAAYYDVNGDGFLTPADVRSIINALNQDETPPTVSVELAHDSAPRGTSDTDQVTFSSRIVGQAIDDLTGIGRVEYSINGGPPQSLIPEPDGSFEITPVLAEGENDVVFRAFDGGNNDSGDSPPLHFTFDTTPPEIAFTDQGPFLTRDNLQVSGQLTDNLAGVESLLAQVDLQDVTDVSFNDNGLFSFAASLPTDATADGQHVVRFRATDRAGNVSTLSTIDWQLDTRPPTVTTTASGLLRNNISTLELEFDEVMAAAAYDVDSYTLMATSGPNSGQAIPIASIDQDGNLATLNLNAPLANAEYRLELSSAVTDGAGNRATTGQLAFTVEQPTAVSAISPADGEELVSLTRETIVRFDGQVDPATVTPDTFYLIANGERLPGTVRVSSTERFATFFYDAPLPPATEVRVMVDGNAIIGRDGLPIDADGDQQPGGVGNADFRTVPLTFIPGTRLYGYIYDSYNRNPDGSDIPVEGATVFLDAAPEVFAVTDENGFFELGLQDLNNDGVADGLPAPEFFVHLDGSTAVNAPSGTAYATLGKPFHTVPGEREQLNMQGEPFDIYLPPMAMDDIVELDPDADTQVGFGTAAEAQIRQMFAADPDTAQMVIDTMQVTYPAGSAQDENGNPATRATVIPVDPERLPAPLPPGMEPQLVVSVQAGTDAGFNLAGGSTNFDVPAPVTFPNLDGLQPGEQGVLWSFDHDAGVWSPVGTATTSVDGTSVLTDDGVGIVAPGWHFLSILNPLGSYNGGGCSNGSSTNPNFTECVKQAKRVFNACMIGVISGAGKKGSFKGGGMGAFVCYYIYAIAIDKCITDDPPCAGTNNGGSSSPGGEGEGAQEEYTLPIGDGDLLRAVLTDIGEVMAIEIIREDDTTVDLLGISELEAEIADLERPFVLQGEAIPNDTQLQIDSLRNQIAAEAKGLDSAQLADRVVPAIEGAFAREFLTVAVDSQGAVLFAATVEDPDGNIRVIRGKTRPDGSYSLQVPRDDTVLEVAFFDPKTLETDLAITTRDQLQQLVLPAYSLSSVLPNEIIDFDLDGLSDQAEFVLGTSPIERDTDNDGIDDRTEVLQGLDPLGGRAFPTGVIAQLALRGEANEVVLSSTPTNPLSQTAYIATGSHGLAIVDASRFDQPVVLGQLELNGDAQDVAVDPVISVAIVAAGEGGLHFVDVSDPMDPRRFRTIGSVSSQVELVDGVAYGVSGSRITAYDALSGEVITSLVVPNSAEFTDLAHEGNLLFALDTDLRLSVIEASRFKLEPRGFVDLPQGGRVSVSNGIAYVGAQESYSLGGFVTVDVADPENPTIISGSDIVDPFVAPGLAVKPNGSGLGLAIGLVGQRIDQPVVGVVDLSNPQATDDYLTQFPLPAPPQGVAIASGIGYVADGSGGLIVVNYVPFDNQGQAPVVTATGPTGSDIQEGLSVPIRVDVTDDVQVRNVELLMDGTVVANDVSAPFELRSVTPSLASGATTVSFQVRATDTGGNTGLSETLTYTLTPDITPPVIVGSSPADDGAGFRVKAITLRFDEPIDTTQLAPSGFTLTNLGANFLPGGGDDTTVRISRLEALSPQRIVVHTEQPLLEGRFQLTGDASIISDVAGNRVAEPIGITFTSFDVDEQNAVAWISDNDGDWNHAGNWSSGEVPGPNDTVILDRKTTNVKVRLPSGNVRIRSLVAREEFIMNGGSLTVSEPSEANARFEIGPGSTLTVDGPQSLFVANAETMVDGGAFVATDGGQIHLPNATSYTNTRGNVTWRVNGTGSLLSLPNATSVTNYSKSRVAFKIEALSGGRIDLHSVTEFVDPDTDSGRTFNVQAVGAGSLIDVTGLVSLQDANSADYSNCCGGFNEGRSTLVVSDGGEFRSPNLLNIHAFALTLDGTGTIPVSQLVSFQDGTLSVKGTDASFDALRDADTTSVVVTGVMGSFPVLNTVASGSITVQDNGSGSFPELSTLTKGSLTLRRGGMATVPKLSVVDGANFTVSDGQTLALPAVTSYTNTRGNVTWRVTGTGSLLSLPNATSVTNYSKSRAAFKIEALSGGRIDLPLVTEFVDPDTDSGRTFNVKSVGIGSLIDVTSLVSLQDANSADYSDCCGGFNEGRSSLVVSDGGEFRSPNLLDIDAFSLTLDGTGAIPVSQLVSFQDGTLTVTAVDQSFDSLIDASTTAVVVTGVSAVFPLLETLASGSITVQDNGSGSFPELTTLTKGSLTLRRGGTGAVPKLTVIDGANFTVSDGQTLALPAVTSYTNTRGNVTWHVTGTGSLLSLPNATSVTNYSKSRVAFKIEALSGGRIDLPLVTEFVDPDTDSGRTFNVKSVGIGSLIDVTSLVSLQDANSADYSDCCGGFNEGRSSLVVSDGGEFRSPNLLDIHAFSLTLDGTGAIPVSQLVSFQDGTLSVKGTDASFDALRDADTTSVFVTGVMGSFPVLNTVASGSITVQDNGSGSFPELTTLTKGSLTLRRGGTGTVPNLSVIDGSNFTVSDGHPLSLPSVTSYTNTRGNVTWRVTGAGSRLSLPNVTSVTNYSARRAAFNIEALSGGQIDLSAVAQFVDPNSDTRGRTYNLKANGVGSLIDVSGLFGLEDVSASDYTDCCGGFTEGRSTLVISDRGKVLTGDASPVIGNFTITINSGGQIEGTLEIAASSILRGADGGVDGDLLNRGTVRPGTSPGVFTVSGNYTQTATGTLEIELGGTGAGVDFDQLQIGGNATLNGSLALNLIDGFDPAVGDTFRVVEYATNTNSFASITGLDLGDGKSLMPTYNATALTLTATSPLLADVAPVAAAIDEVTTTPHMHRLLDAAIQRWVASGMTARQETALGDIQLYVVDLPGSELARAGGDAIWIDATGAGLGWFVDDTPLNDEEYSHDGRAIIESAAGHFDLLTVLMHEIGHLLGHDHADDEDHLMSTMLAPGERHLDAALVDTFFAEKFDKQRDESIFF